VFAPDYAPEEITEIAQKLREQAGLPEEPTGLVSDESADLVDVLAGKAKRQLSRCGRPSGENEGRPAFSGAPPGLLAVGCGAPRPDPFLRSATSLVGRQDLPLKGDESIQPRSSTQAPVPATLVR
jgi:hypothetical protein